MIKPWLFLVPCLLVLTIGCVIGIPLPTPTASPPLHFENEIVAFDYPGEAKLFTPPQYTRLQAYGNHYTLGGDLVVGFANPFWTDENGILFSLISIHRYGLPAGSSLEDVMQTAYVSPYGLIPDEVPELSGPFSVDGHFGVRRTYKNASGPLWYNTQDIWMEVDGSILRISLTMEVYEGGFEEDSELFLSSLEIKDDLPPFTEQSTQEPTATSTPFPANQLKHFESNTLAFDYPQTLTVLPLADLPALFPELDFEGELLACLGDARFLVNGTYYRSIQITRKQMSQGANLELEALGAYEVLKLPQDPSSVFSKGAVPVSDMTGLQLPYRVTAGEPTYELRDIWLQVNDQIYIVSIWTEYTNPEDFWAFQSGAQALLDSLVIR